MALRQGLIFVCEYRKIFEKRRILFTENIVKYSYSLSRLRYSLCRRIIWQWILLLIKYSILSIIDIIFKYSYSCFCLIDVLLQYNILFVIIGIKIFEYCTNILTATSDTSRLSSMPHMLHRWSTGGGASKQKTHVKMRALVWY